MLKNQVWKLFQKLRKCYQAFIRIAFCTTQLCLVCKLEFFHSSFATNKQIKTDKHQKLQRNKFCQYTRNVKAFALLSFSFRMVSISFFKYQVSNKNRKSDLSRFQHDRFLPKRPRNVLKSHTVFLKQRLKATSFVLTESKLVSEIL